MGYQKPQIEEVKTIHWTNNELQNTTQKTKNQLNSNIIY